MGILNTGEGRYMLGSIRKSTLPDKAQALPGRASAIKPPSQHYVNGHNLLPPYPVDIEYAMFGLGCFWGAERRFWESQGIYVTAVGYSAGLTPNPTYQEVCSGQTGHNEVVQLIYSQNDTAYLDLLKIFWNLHDPTQGMRQGNDMGTQYRSGIYYYTSEQQTLAEQSREKYQQILLANDKGMITTEIIPAGDFYYAEEYHQQYLAKNPGGYCGSGGTGVEFAG